MKIPQVLVVLLASLHQVHCAGRSLRATLGTDEEVESQGSLQGERSAVDICHFSSHSNNPDKFKTISVHPHAVDDHIAKHGDFLGSCNDNCEKICNDANACTVDDYSNCEDVGCPLSDQEREAVNCDDGDLCTLDSCDPVDGCANEPIICASGETCNPTTGACEIMEVSYSGDFVQGEAPDEETCDAWTAFRSQLLPNITFTTITLSGSRLASPVTIHHSTLVNIFAQAVHTGTSVYYEFSPNMVVHTGFCPTRLEPVSYSIAFWDPTQTSTWMCTCNSDPSVHMIRPCVDIANWFGGFGGTVCNANLPSQSMTITFSA